MREYSASELYHHGIKGQKWGIRRFQNEDGSLTEEGRKRYAKYVRLATTSEEIQKKREEVFAEAEKYNSRYYQKRNAEMDALWAKFKKEHPFYTDSEYSQYLDQENKIWKHYQKAIESGKWSYKNVQQAFDDIMVEAIGFDDAEVGRQMVTKFNNMKFEYDYLKYRGKDY